MRRKARNQGASDKRINKMEKYLRKRILELLDLYREDTLGGGSGSSIVSRVEELAAFAHHMNIEVHDIFENHETNWIFAEHIKN